MDTSSTVKATRAGAVAVLDKPVRYDLLEDAVEEAFLSLQSGGAHSCQFCDARRSGARDDEQSRLSFGGLTAAEVRQLQQRFLTLSGREVQVAELVCKGLTNREIGIRLGISGRTVEKHRARAMAKLEVRTLTEFTLAMAALREFGTAA